MRNLHKLYQSLHVCMHGYTHAYTGGKSFSSEAYLLQSRGKNPQEFFLGRAMARDSVTTWDSDMTRSADIAACQKVIASLPFAAEEQALMMAAVGTVEAHVCVSVCVSMSVHVCLCVSVLSLSIGVCAWSVFL